MSHTLNTIEKDTNLLNLTDAFLMLSLSAALNRTNAAVRTTAYHILKRANEEATQFVTDIVIAAQEPLKAVDKVMDRYQGDPYNMAEYRAQVDAGTFKYVFTPHYQVA